jgi:hypothetical protein
MIQQQFNKKRRNPGPGSLTTIVTTNTGNKGGSGSHKAKSKKASGSFSLKSTRLRRKSNAQAIAMHGNISSMVEGFTSGERRLLRYLLLGVAREKMGEAVTELKQIVLDVSYKSHLFQVLSVCFLYPYILQHPHTLCFGVHSPL